jgi:hypothetical protein
MLWGAAAGALIGGGFGLAFLDAFMWESPENRVPFQEIKKWCEIVGAVLGGAAGACVTFLLVWNYIRKKTHGEFVGKRQFVGKAATCATTELDDYPRQWVNIVSRE